MRPKTKQVIGLAAGALLLVGCSTNAESQEEVAVQGASQERQEMTVEESDFISLDEAKQIAFEDAGVDGEQAQFDDEEFDEDDREYELEFYVDGVEYEYDIDAVTGDILESERDEKDHRKNRGSELTKQNSGFISLNEAKQIAFDHAGVSGENAHFDDQELEKDDRKYELEFYVDGVEYEYDIHAVDGSILEAERDGRDDDRAKAKNQQTKEESKEQKQPEKQQESKSDRITKEEALEIALNDAGLSRQDIVIDEIELDDGKYEIEFDSGAYEYEYDVHVGDGSILDREVEMDD